MLNLPLKSFGPSWRTTQLVTRLSGTHQHWKIVARFDFFQIFHHLGSVHAGKSADRAGLDRSDFGDAVRRPLTDCNLPPRGADGNIAATTQHTLQQLNIGFLIVDDQDFAVKNVR